MIAYYHTDLLNFPDEKENIYAGLVAFTCQKTGLSTEEVERIFANADKKISAEPDSTVPPLKVTDTNDGKVKLISCGHIHYEISSETWRNLGKDHNFLVTFLNYSFLNPESGLFWSIAQEIYNPLSTSSYGLKVLECFASPFNYNINSFCSVFSADAKLKYPEGVLCYGDFFYYIEQLKNHPDPVRLIINPPYTDRVIDAVGEKVASYFATHDNAEFIAMLPDWTPQAGIEKLLALPGSVSHHFAAKEFYLYDSIKQKTIQPVGMKMLLVVNIGSDTTDSQEKLDELTEIIKKVTARINQA
jgi:hypothetical protein